VGANLEWPVRKERARIEKGRTGREAGSGNWTTRGLAAAAAAAAVAVAVATATATAAGERKEMEGEGEIALYAFLSCSASNSICASLRF